jgi:hypothetical protein
VVNVVYRIRHPQKRAFLAAYRQSGNIRASTEAAKVTRQTYYNWCEDDLVFAAAARTAKEEFGDLLEDKLAQMSLKQDNVTALIVGLKMAGRFVERTRSELSGPEGQPIQIDVDSKEQLASRIAGLAARIGVASMAGGSE